MAEEKKRILFMDDETATSDVVQLAVEALRAQGWEVDEVDRMTVAQGAFYERYYHAFVLDIDMSQVDDPGAPDDGESVGACFRALDDDARVVLFSARGSVRNWFAAANHHVRAYVHKNGLDPCGELVRRVREAMSGPAAEVGARPLPAPRTVLLACLPPCRVGAPAVEDALRRSPAGPFEIETTGSLSEAVRRLESSPERYGLVIGVSEMLDATPSVEGLLLRLRASSPRPNVVFGCAGDPANVHGILMLVNARPFRLLDLRDEDLDARLDEAIAEAIGWYGRAELLRPSPESLRRLRVELPAHLVEPSHSDDGWWEDGGTEEEPGRAEQEEAP